jgi:hypothetical protein
MSDDFKICISVIGALLVIRDMFPIAFCTYRNVSAVVAAKEVFDIADLDTSNEYQVRYSDIVYLSFHLAKED